MKRAAVSLLFLAACAASARPPKPLPMLAEKPPSAPAPVLPPPEPALPECVEQAALEETPSESPPVDDGFEPPPAEGTQQATALDSMTDAEIEKKLDADASSLGSMSLGGVHSGGLLFGVQMPDGPSWEVVHKPLAWGTKETVTYLQKAIETMAAQHPNGPKVFIGDLGARNGGHLPPHVSHQGGRDVDIGYVLHTGHRWYAPANAQNLDLARSWALVRAFVTETDAEMILIDTSVQKLLKQHALSIGEDKAWLDEVFQFGGKSKRPLIFHAHGHATHLHVRFYAPASQELARRAHPWLLKKKLIKPPTWYIDHTVAKGETLGGLAARYKTSPDAIKKANGLTGNVIRAGFKLKIPRKGGIERAARLAMPARKLPPAKLAEAPKPEVVPCKR